MYEEIEKLRHRFWLTSDEKTRLYFQDNKGLAMVKVYEYEGSRTEHMYLLLPTLESNVFAFDTPNGRFTIGISSTGDELFISPLGVFLYPYGTTGCKPQPMNINGVASLTVDDTGAKAIN